MVKPHLIIMDGLREGRTAEQIQQHAEKLGYFLSMSLILDGMTMYRVFHNKVNRTRKDYENLTRTIKDSEKHIKDYIENNAVRL